MLLNTQNKNIDFKVLKRAIYSTAEHRNTTEIIKDSQKVIKELKYSDTKKIISMLKI